MKHMEKLDLLNLRCPHQSAFITGAASGLGAAFAHALAEDGWSLYLADINTERLHQLSAELGAARHVALYTLDVSEIKKYAQVAQKVRTQTNVDLVINNAGIGDGELLQNYRPELWEKMIQINLMGVYYGCHLFVNDLVQQGHGMIINIGSAAGAMNAPGMSAYNAAKAAVYSLSETLYHELRPQGVQVSVATPTFFPTGIMSSASGSQPFVEFATHQMNNSTTHATEMSRIILTEAARGTFHIVHPREAKKHLFIKKWWPKSISKRYERLMKRFLNK